MTALGVATVVLLFVAIPAASALFRWVIEPPIRRGRV